MTTDIERELRELFQEKVAQASIATPADAPEQLRRARRRQVGTILGSAAIALVLIVGSVAGLNALQRGEEDPFTVGDDYEVFERTATIEAFSVSSPSDWFLVNEWPLSMQIAVRSGSASKECTVGVEPQVCTGSEQTNVEPLPHGLPMLQLSNTDLGLSTVACGEDLATDAAVLYVALDYQRSIEGIADPSIGPWPAELREPGAAGGVCGAGRYATFSVNGEPFFAWVGFGEGVTDADRSTVLTAFESMGVDDSWEPVPPDQTTPAYVIAAGATDAGARWSLELRRSQENVRLSLAETGTALSDFTVPSASIEWAATDPIFGAITKAATGVEFRGQDDPSVAISGTIVPLPPSMPFDFDLFFIEGTTGIEGEVVAIGPDGESLEGPVSIGRLRGDTVHLRGSLSGHDWVARFTGAFADATACIRVIVDGEGGEPLCPRPIATSLAGDQPSLRVVNTTHLALVVGSVPTEVAEIRFMSDSGNTTPSQFQCQMGPAGWTDPDRRVCAIALPPQDGGIFEYLDADGDVLFEDGMAWFVSQGEPVGPMPVDPVHGGTYWAVYPWVGATGSPEADDVSAQLLEEFGIEVFPGDLTCDQGAAEAIGANNGIGVYFDTEEDANAFAEAYRAIDPDTDPPVARVTTYCLD